MNKKIRVLVVDDSAVARQAFRDILSSDLQIELMGIAADPFAAAELISREIPDVITLDVEMPRMDGITSPRKIMSQHPIPVLMCSSLTEKGSETAFRAPELGAVDIIQKPRLGVKQFLEESKVLICDAVKAAAMAKVRRISPGLKEVPPKLTADAVIVGPSGKAMIRTTEKVVAVGESTGGTEALRTFLEAMPADAPGIVIVQHMPEHFSRSFAARLDGLCRISVKEAENNDTVIRGRALIAPGNRHAEGGRQAGRR